jgi:hypothetical protein
MASWGLDFVKVDDLSGHNAEIEAVRKAIDKCGRPIVFSISPGGASNSEVAANANMWRISGDFWDNWGALYSQFNNASAGTPFRGPGHWPDADMIPFGNIRTWNEKDHLTHFTRDEHYTLMTLWAIARSPLILGANLPENDEFTLSMLTNDEVIAVDQNSENNKQVFNKPGQVAWVADAPGSKDKYLAMFNTAPAPVGARRGGRRAAPTSAAAATTPEPLVSAPPASTNPATTQPAEISVSLADIGLSGNCKVRDLWSHKDLGAVTGTVTATVNSHGAVLYRIEPAN